MTPELIALALAALLQAVQLMLYAVPGNRELGVDRTMSPRDPDPSAPPLAEQLSRRTGRLQRAYNNHNEALLLFAVAVALVTLSDSGSAFTAACAWIYLAARVLYVPAYALGWVPWRSLFFAAGWLATLALVLATLI